MSTDGLEGIRMDESESRMFLRERGHGVLSLADESEAYGLPVSYGYDEEKGLFLYLLEFGSGGKKFDYIEETERACLTVYDVESPDAWRSVIVSGRLREFGAERTGTELTEKMVVRSVMDESAWFPTFDVGPDELTGQRTFLFTVDELTGRKASNR
jgi:hypothetical protein